MSQTPDVEFDWTKYVNFNLGPGGMIKAMFDMVTGAIQFSPLKWMQEQTEKLHNLSLETNIFFENAMKNYRHLRNQLNPQLNPQEQQSLQNHLNDVITLSNDVKNLSGGVNIRIFKPVVGFPEDLRDKILNSLNEKEVSYLAGVEKTGAFILIFQVDAAQVSLLFTLLIAIVGLFVSPAKGANLLQSLAQNPFFNKLKEFLVMFVEEMTKLGQFAIDFKEKIIDGFGGGIVDAIKGDPTKLDQNLASFLDGALDEAGEIVNDTLFSGPIAQTAKDFLNTNKVNSAPLGNYNEEKKPKEEAVVMFSMMRFFPLDMEAQKRYKYTVTNVPMYVETKYMFNEGAFYPTIKAFDLYLDQLVSTDFSLRMDQNILNEYLNSKPFNRPDWEDLEKKLNYISSLLTKYFNFPSLPSLPKQQPDPPPPVVEEKKKEKDKQPFEKTLNVLKSKFQNPFQDVNKKEEVVPVQSQKKPIREDVFINEIKPLIAIYLDAIIKVRSAIEKAISHIYKHELNPSVVLEAIIPENGIEQEEIIDGVPYKYDYSKIMLSFNIEKYTSIKEITDQVSKEDHPKSKSLEQLYNEFVDDMDKAFDSPYLDKWLGFSLEKQPSRFGLDGTTQIADNLFKAVTSPVLPSKTEQKIMKVHQDIQDTLLRYIMMLSKAEAFIMQLLEFFVDIRFIPFAIHYRPGDIGRLRFVINDRLNSQQPGAPSNEQIFVPVMFVTGAGGLIDKVIEALRGGNNAS